MRTLRRHTSRTMVGGLVLVAGATLAASTPAAGQETGIVCTFTPSLGELRLSGAGNAGLRDLGPAIEVSGGVATWYGESLEPIPCLSSEPPFTAVEPTNASTETIVVDTVGALTMSSAGASFFEPGRTAEAGVSEIETVLGDSLTDLWVRFGAGAHSVELGTVGSESAISLNADQETGPETDVDIVFRGEPPPATVHDRWVTERHVQISAADVVADDRFDASGGEGFDGPFPVGVWLDGGEGNDLLTAGAAGAFLWGDTGTDVVRGSQFDDFLGACGAGSTAEAFGGDDRLEAGGRSTTVDGGDGNDIAQFGCAGSVHVDLRISGPQDIGYGVAPSFTGIESLEGGAGNDVLIGNEGANTLWGAEGADRLRGKGGDDRLKGWEGRDRLTGGKGRDRMAGEDSIDRLFARDGAQDAGIDCGFPRASRERAQRDAVDPPARHC